MRQAFAALTTLALLAVFMPLYARAADTESPATTVVSTAPSSSEPDSSSSSTESSSSPDSSAPEDATSTTETPPATVVVGGVVFTEEQLEEIGEIGSDTCVDSCLPALPSPVRLKARSTCLLAGPIPPGIERPVIDLRSDGWQPGAEVRVWFNDGEMTVTADENGVVGNPWDAVEESPFPGVYSLEYFPNIDWPLSIYMLGPDSGPFGTADITTGEDIADPDCLTQDTASAGSQAPSASSGTLPFTGPETSFANPSLLIGLALALVATGLFVSRRRRPKA